MDDWRITNQKRYLDKVKIIKSNILEFPEKDHEHCCFCWAKFGKSFDMLKEGYCTIDHNHWICEICYNDFKDMFRWKVEEE